MLSDSKTRIPANDFARQWADTRESAMEAIDRVGNSGRLILGEEVGGFERELAEWWGVRYAVGVASGLDALEIVLRCANLSAGTRVLTTPLSAFATTLAILRAGAQPVWCDVDDAGGLDLEQVDMALRRDPSIKAVLAVHLYGHPLDPDALQKLAAEHGVTIVEDCAQSAGAQRNGKPTGTVGLASGTSLYPTKNLGAMGDGGLLLTSEQTVAERARRLRHYGQSDHYHHIELGMNSRLDELHAAILRSAFLPRLDGWLARRREIAARYAEGLRNCGLRPISANGGVSACHLFPVEALEGAPAVIAERLVRRGISIGRHYPFVAPDQPAAQARGVVIGELATARRLAERELSLPLHPYLDDEEVERVIDACSEVCG